MQSDLEELSDLRRAWEALRPLWHPTSALTAAFDETLNEGAKLGERAHVEATLSELKTMRASRGIPPAVNRTRAATLASKSGVLQRCWGAVVEACHTQGGGTLGGVVQRLSALSGSLHARHTELILLLLEEVLEREKEKQQRLAGGGGGQEGKAEVGVETDAPPPTTSSSSSPMRSPLRSPHPPSLATPARKLLSSSSSSSSQILSPLHHAPPTLSVPSTPSSSSSSSSTHHVLPPLAPTNRLMTLRGLHDFLSALYASKERADATARETRQPLETLEQHLYTHLRHTVGLKVLIAAQAKAFLSAVETLGNSDMDALIAHKVLQNDVNEGFIRDAGALRGECNEALRRVIREVVVPPGGGSEAVAVEMSARVGPRATPLVPVPEVEWRGVLDNLAARFPSPGDKESAVGVLQGVVKRGAAAWALGLGDGSALLHQQQEGGLGSALESAVEGLSEEEAAVLVHKCNPTKTIAWLTLVNALVHMALVRQERFLGGFVRVWRGGDEERRGWLHVSDFVKAVEVGAPDAAPSARSLAGQFMDRGVHTVTFSQAVECMAEIAEVEERVREARVGSGAVTRAAADAAASAASFASLQAAQAMADREEEMRSLYARVLLAEAAAAAPPPPPPLPPATATKSFSASRTPFLISPPPQRAAPPPPSFSSYQPFPPPLPPPPPPAPSFTTTSTTSGAALSMTSTPQPQSYPTTKQRSRRSSLVMPSLHQLAHFGGGGDNGGGKGAPPPLPQNSAPSRQHFTSMIIPGKGAKVLY